MFRFNFVEDDEIDEHKPEELQREPSGTGTRTNSLTKAPELEHILHDIPIRDLLDALPPIISYSTLDIPISGRTSKVTLARRDLYDVRYQLIAQEGEGNTGVHLEKSNNADGPDKAELSFVDNPSDLAPGLYEGGLKTWECSLDLVDVLEGKVKSERGSGWVRGKRIFEIGCGTAVPSLYLLQQLLQEPPSQEESMIVLQDFNELVLRLVTFPNVFLTWYTSPLAEHFRAEQGPSSIADETEDNTVNITQNLRDAFSQSLQERHISLRFLAGSWDAILYTKNLFESPFDVILTSETIYRTASLLSLITLLRRACGEDDRIPSMDSEVRRISLQSGTLCLVAAKVLYFGVGGGIVDFENMVQNRGGSSEVMYDKTTGVGRRVLRLQWSTQ